jgi:aspartyl-tRNA(Asn)/glutamyl-tRNA(Gln) amidotransferase subunit C
MSDDAGTNAETDADVDAEAGVDADAVDAEVEAVDPEEVRHVAGLARVELADDDVDRFTEQFAEILASFEALDEVPEVKREEELANVMRPDEEREGLSQEDALSNAPETEDGYFKGPRVS